MRAGEINGLIKVSGLSSVCTEVCKHTELKVFFGTDDDDKANGELIAALEKFLERRNEIAHSLTSASSSAHEEMLREVKMFAAFAKDLCSTLGGQIG